MCSLDRTMPDERFMDEAIALARDNVRSGGRPFGAVVVRNGEVVGRGVNGIHRTQDPTAHAELEAIREASRRLGSASLEGCVVYASGHPCPMCLAAMHLCGIQQAWFAYSNEEGEAHGLSSAAVYGQMARPPGEQSLALRRLRPAGEGGLYDEWSRERSLRGG